MFSALVKATDAVATLSLREALRGDAHTFLQLQFTVRNDSGAIAVPGTGTLTVKAKSLHAPAFLPVTNGNVDLTVDQNWLLYIERILPAELEFTPAGLPGSWTYEVAVTQGR